MCVSNHVYFSRLLYEHTMVLVQTKLENSILSVFLSIWREAAAVERKVATTHERCELWMHRGLLFVGRQWQTSESVCSWVKGEPCYWGDNWVLTMWSTPPPPPYRMSSLWWLMRRRHTHCFRPESHYVRVCVWEQTLHDKRTVQVSGSLPNLS